MLWRYGAIIAVVTAVFLVLDTGSLSGAATRVSGVMVEMAPVLTIIGVCAAARAWQLRVRGRRAVHWPATTGVITRSEVVSKKMRRLWDQSRAGSQTKRRYYQPIVRYTYEVDGARFEGDRAQFGGVPGVAGWGSSRAAADAHVAPYTTGQPVRVYYDPNRPADSVLDLRMSPRWRQSVMFAAAALWLGLCGWMLRLSSGT